MKPEELLKGLPSDMKRNALLSMGGADSPEVMQAQIQALTDIVYSLCQELETLRGILKSKELMSESEYKSARLQLMLRDHSGVGPSPWLFHSYYRYFLDEEDFLKADLKMNDEEIKEFQHRAKVNESLT